MVLAPGASIGPYEIVAHLGGGGMGDVWKARDRRLGRLVALKVVKPGEADPESRRRFLREAQIASRLTHPNVCTLHDVGSEGDVDYLVLELLEGETLQQRLSRGPLAADELLGIAREVAAGLAKAHAEGFVHRDLKPSNVFLAPTGAKILDFGLARQGPGLPDEGASTVETASALTAPGVVMGTVGYMSPEQVRGENAAPPSDVFSFGAVLWEMATGRRAFRGDTAVETLHAILKSDPPPLPGREAGQPDGLRIVVERCLAKDPARRFANGAELAEALRGPSTPSVESVPAGGAPAPTRRRPWRAGLAVAGLLVAALAGVLALRARRAPPLDSLAILPFANSTGNPELAWVGDGLTESLIRAMARLPGLRVMASSTVARFREAAADPIAAGRDLGVKAVLTGSVRSAGDRLDVSVSLIDARDGSHLWGESYEREGERVPALQAEIAGEIVRALRLRLSGEARRQISAAATVDRDAYLLNLKGRYHWAKRTQADLVKALDLFRQALDRDPAYAPAWAGLAATWDVLGYVGYRSGDEAFPRAKDAARKALEIDPSNAPALAVLAHVTWLHDHDAAASEALFRKALAADPSAVDAHHWYAHFLSQNGRLDESFREGKTLLDLEPLSLVANIHLAEELELRGRHEDAAEQLRKTIDLDAGFYPAWILLGKLELKRGRPVEALAALREVERLEPDAPGLKQALAEAAAGAGGKR
ncbi:MAG: protein kinase [Thermoanaerobaculia bacterium]